MSDFNKSKQRNCQHDFAREAAFIDTKKELLDDPCLQLLQKEIQETPMRGNNFEVEVGQVILLQNVLQPGQPLYDLTVDGDASFVAGGMVVHNSRCRCRVLVRRVSMEETKQALAGASHTREGYLRKLKQLRYNHKH